MVFSYCNKECIRKENVLVCECFTIEDSTKKQTKKQMGAWFKLFKLECINL